ncbi:hypothetical protein UMM65_13880 [Aureibaculum sp. 2210JD6-5]|uniref:hypothetical protein n=1 Tax=Aureibaculum sp. 2210JD6-5 TaxID=3103957 RepID=UPI002AAF040C|nr:hypothetical protein [Aureibaculum sp. 2210JD6-5]MDY7396336.1 hypothetical protein [Aureibaculum sp. 2210JD6-5]
MLLEPNQVVTFNGLRYCVDICDISSQRLYENLSDLTDRNEIEPLDFPRIFLDVWSIVNNSQMFAKLICKEFPIDKNEPKLQEFHKAKNLRDSNQHMEERISNDRSLSELPVFGFLSWRKVYSDSEKFTLSTIYSGSFTNKTGVSMPISNKKEFELNEKIQKIEFTNVIREKDENGSWIFKEETISLSKLLADLKGWIKHFDKSINEQFEKYDVSEKHVSDLIIKMEAKYVVRSKG